MPLRKCDWKLEIHRARWSMHRKLWSSETDWALQALLRAFPRGEIGGASWANHGMIPFWKSNHFPMLVKKFWHSPRILTTTIMNQLKNPHSKAGMVKIKLSKFKGLLKCLILTLSEIFSKFWTPLTCNSKLKWARVLRGVT